VISQHLNGSLGFALDLLGILTHRGNSESIVMNSLFEIPELINHVMTLLGISGHRKDGDINVGSNQDGSSESSGIDGIMLNPFIGSKNSSEKNSSSMTGFCSQAWSLQSSRKGSGLASGSLVVIGNLIILAISMVKDIRISVWHRLVVSTDVIYIHSLLLKGDREPNTRTIDIFLRGIQHSIVSGEHFGEARVSSLSQNNDRKSQDFRSGVG